MTADGAEATALAEDERTGALRTARAPGTRLPALAGGGAWLLDARPGGA